MFLKVRLRTLCGIYIYSLHRVTNNFLHCFRSADVQRYTSTRYASIIVWNLWNGICYSTTTIVRVRMVRMSRMSHSAMQVM